MVYEFYVYNYIQRVFYSQLEMFLFCPLGSGKLKEHSATHLHRQRYTHTHTHPHTHTHTHTPTHTHTHTCTHTLIVFHIPA